MGLFLSDASGHVVVSGTATSLPRLAAAVAGLGLPARRLAPGAPPVVDGAGMMVVDRRVVSGVRPSRPAVIVRGLSPNDRTLPPLGGSGITTLPAHRLRPCDVLGAMLDAELQVEGDRLERLFDGLPAVLSAEFLRRPAVLRRRDIEAVLHLSRDRTRRWLQEHGFRCPAHLNAWYRARAWRTLVHKEVRREVVEAHLGITWRDNFARACRRAGVAVPWHGLQGSGT